MPSNYMFYKVTMEKVIGQKQGLNGKPENIYRAVTKTGIVRNTPHAFGDLFRQHSEFLPCVRVVSEEYTLL